MTNFVVKNTIKYERFFLLLAAYIVTVICLFFGTYGPKTEEVQVGAVAPTRYVARRDTLDTIATQKQRDLARKSVSPLYKLDEGVKDVTLGNLAEFFVELDRLLLMDGELAQNVKRDSLGLPLVLSQEQCDAYQGLTYRERADYQKTLERTLETVYNQGVTQDSMTKGRELIKDTLEDSPYPKNLRDMGSSILFALLKPNLVLDEEAMTLAREKKASEVNDIIIKKDQKIVDQGEIVTQEIYDKLAALNLIKSPQDQKNKNPLWGGVIIVSLVFVAVYLYFVSIGHKNKLKENEARMIFTNYMILVILIQVLSGVSNFSLLPLAVFSMLVSVLVHQRVALLFNTFMVILACILYGGDVEFILYFLLTGSFGALVMQYTEKRQYVVPAAMGMAGVNFLCMVSLGMLFEKELTHGLLVAGGYGALLGLISVILTIGSLPFWESAFEANTSIRLLELTNPNNELLRRLMIEAPGTYHHSLIVANLAETAAYDIGANATLARVGSYYHDLGKLKFPLYFGENQGGDNPHDHLEPYSSAQMIAQHTRLGVELGKEKGLPKSILGIIGEHHGTSLVKYFYFKAIKLYGSEAVKEEDYRYEGPIPQTKEAAIVMLADTVEAAVRSLLGNGQTLEQAEQLMHTLIRDKLEDGQLDKSFLAISDLEIIEAAFRKVFHGMYHNRVAYPKPEELKEARRKKEGEPVQEPAEKPSESVERAMED